MPTEVGELEARVPSMAVTGLQRNVIAMAFCCKNDGGQHQGNPSGPLRHMCHMPYCYTPESALHRLDLTTRLKGHSLKRAFSCVRR